MKRIGIVCVVFALCGCDLPPAPAAGTSAAGSATAAPAAPARKVVTVTARELFAEYEANEVAADERFKGVTIRVTGKVASIDKSLFDSMFVVLRTSNQFAGVHMEIDKSQASAVAKLRVGQSVVIECEGMKKQMLSPTGSDCHIVG